MIADHGLDGHVVIVTGAGRGLGRSHAILLASSGARVVVNDLGPEPGERDVAADVAAEITRVGGTAVVSHADVATSRGGADLVDLAIDEFGKVDAVVHNAGTAESATFGDTPDDLLKRQLAVHLGGCYYVGQPAWRHMRAAGYGRLVFTSSAAAFGWEGHSAYASAKAAMIGLVATVAAEARSAAGDLRVNVVMPAAITRMSSPSYRQIFGALGDPVNVSAVIAHLAGANCRLQGACVRVGGSFVGGVHLALGHGWAAGRKITPADVMAHIEEACAPQPLIVPRDHTAVLETMTRRIDEARGGSAPSGI